MRSSLTLLLPTTGRPTLYRALLSLQDQAWEPGDEIMLLSDDNYEATEVMLRELGFYNTLPLILHLKVPGGPHKDWGHTPRNLFMPQASGGWLCHFDDDDVAMKTMVGDIHNHCFIEPKVFLFRMRDYKSGRLVWDRKGLLKRRHVSTQNIVHPNDPSTFGVWGDFYGGDSQFIIQTAAHYPGKVIWPSTITCVYNPPADLSVAQARVIRRTTGSK